MEPTIQGFGFRDFGGLVVLRFRGLGFGGFGGVKGVGV